jgi:hypothetical protein
MKPIVKAALFGAVLATAVFFLHFLIPVLLLLLFFGLIRRAVFGPRWHRAYAGYGPNTWAQRTPTVDGRDWQRPGGADAEQRDVRVN